MIVVVCFFVCLFVVCLLCSVNVLQSVYLVDFALPYLNQSHGIIVPVSSLSGIYLSLIATWSMTASLMCVHMSLLAMLQDILGDFLNGLGVIIMTLCACMYDLGWR